MGARPQTLAGKRLRALVRRERRRLRHAPPAPEPPPRPRTRADCVDGPRPCPWVSCKHHLYLDVDPETGAIKLNFPDLAVDELEETCALDVAEEGGPDSVRGRSTLEAGGLLELDAIGHLMNLSREGVRVIEDGALRKLLRANVAEHARLRRARRDP